MPTGFENVWLNFVPCSGCNGHGIIQVFCGDELRANLPAPHRAAALYAESHLVAKGGNPQPKYLTQVAAVSWTYESEGDIPMAERRPVVVLKIHLSPIQ